MKNISINVLQYIKKHDNIFVILIILLSILGITLNVLIINSDELWNFQSIYKMYNGFQIYKEFNVIITPLFFWVGEIIFHILGANFFAFRIYNLIIMLALFYITYLLLKEIGISKKTSTIIVILLIVLKKYLIVLFQANYSVMALMLCILGVLLCIKNIKINRIIQGILLFLIFCTKQNIGVYFAIGLFFYEILRKDNLKTKIKNLIIEYLTFIILFIVLLFYFYYNNNLYDFINYTFLGIREFANKNLTFEISNIIIAVFLIGINLTLTIFFIKNKKIIIETKEKQQLITLNCFAIPLTLIMYPIVNESHSILGIYLSIILFIDLIKIILRESNLKIDRKIINTLLTILIISTSIYSSFNFYCWKINKNYEQIELKNGEENPFYGGIINQETIDNINNIIKYIENNDNKVVVLSSKAALYMIPLQRNNGDMDLPFNGNFGKEGENGLIEKIKNEKNLEVLIEKEEKNIIYQESELVRKYIMENMKKIGEIEEFYIYEKKANE